MIGKVVKAQQEALHSAGWAGAGPAECNLSYVASPPFTEQSRSPGRAIDDCGKEAKLGGMRMFSLFKRRVSPTELGFSLVELVDWGTPIFIDSLKTTLDLVSGEETKKAVRLEFIPLRVFSIDFEIAMCFGKSPHCRAALDSFYSGFRRMLVNKSMLCLFDFAAERGEAYAKAVREFNSKELHMEIGRLFAKNCGFPDSKEVVRAGVVIFGGTRKTILDGLNKLMIR